MDAAFEADAQWGPEGMGGLGDACDFELGRVVVGAEGRDGDRGGGGGVLAQVKAA